MGEQSIELNMEQIMNEIEEEARMLPHEEIPSFDSVPIENTNNMISAPVFSSTDDAIQKMAAETDYLRATAYNTYYWEMGKGIKGFVKRAIRRINKCLVYPMSEHQNDFNSHVVNSLEFAIQTINSQRDQINQNERQIQYLQKQLALVKDQLTEKNQQQDEKLRTLGKTKS